MLIAIDNSPYKEYNSIKIKITADRFSVFEMRGIIHGVLEADQK